jgi:DNA-binding transcriptional LysR family regulator
MTTSFAASSKPNPGSRLLRLPCLPTLQIPLELRHLRYFCAVAETLNFSRAAQNLHVAQSALSRQIRDLENELGFKLFVRTTTTVRLTDAGRQFFGAAQKLLAQLAIAVSSAQQVAKGKAGALNIASDWRVPVDLIPGTVRKFRQQNPKVTVNFVDLLISEQLDALRAGKVHLAFVPDIILGASEDLELLQVYTSKIVVLLPASHPLAKEPLVHLRDLSKEKWITVHEKSGQKESRFYLTQACRPAGFTPLFGRVTNTLHGVATLVSAGEGIGLLPELVAPTNFRGVCAPKTDCPALKMYAAWLKQDTTPLVRPYLEILHKELKAYRK